MLRRTDGRERVASGSRRRTPESAPRRIDRAFNPSMRRSALWTAHSLLVSCHPRRSHERRALSLNERRQRAFRYQSAEGLAWLVARAVSGHGYTCGIS